MVIGTTGLTAGQLATVQSTSDHTAVCMASNFATGVNLCFKLAEIAALALGDDADIEISESHHKHKIDAPSGTALSSVSQWQMRWVVISMRLLFMGEKINLVRGTPSLLAFLRSELAILLATILFYLPLTESEWRLPTRRPVEPRLLEEQ